MTFRTGDGLEVNGNSSIGPDGTLKAPIFYDSSNTDFYVDPVGSSKLYGTLFLGHTNGQPGHLTLYDTGNNRLEFKGTGANTFVMDLEGTGSDGALTITQFNVGIGAATDASHRLKVSDSGHNYLWIEATSGTNEAMTRYKNPTSNNWYTGIRNSTQNSITNTGYHIYSSAFNATTGGWNASGQFFTANEGYALASFRAPYFYDSNDTTYYADPANISNFTRLNLHYSQVWNETTQGGTPGSLHLDPNSPTDHAGGAITFGASDTSNGTNAHAGIYVRSDGSYGTKMYLSTTDSYGAGSKTALKIDQAGVVSSTRSRIQSASDMRANYFYDTDDTTYYVNPASSNSKLVGLNIHGGANNNTNDATLYVNKTSNADWGIKIDGSASATEFGLKVDLNGTHNVAAQFLQSGSEYSRIGTDFMQHNAGIRSFKVIGGTSSVGLTNNGPLAVYDTSNPYLSFHTGAARTAYIQELAGRFYFGEVPYTETEGSFRAPLFYDSNNTNFYMDPQNSTFLNQLNVSKLQVDGMQVLDMPNNSGERGPWNPIATSIRNSGRKIYGDEDFANGMNGVSVYNNAGGNAVTITHVTATSDPGLSAPNSSGKLLKIAFLASSSAGSSPGLGGFYQTIPAEDNHTFVQLFQAKLPVGRTLYIAENSQGNNATSYFLTSAAGTGKFEWYARVSHCGDAGTFSGGGHIYVQGGSGDFNWYLASCTCIDVTESHQLFNRQFIADMDMRAPLFYDSADTTYYEDPASSRVLKGLSLLKAGHSSSHNEVLRIGRTDDAYRYHSLYATNNSTASVLEFRIHDGTSSVAQTATLSVRQNLSSTGDRGTLIHHGTRLGFDESGTRSWTMKATGGALNLYSGDGGGSLVSGITGGFRAPIFYDVHDTNYYIHPGDTTISGKFRQTVIIGDGSQLNSNDGSWGARLNLTDSVHSKIEIGQDANSMKSHWYAHTGHTSIKFGTSTAHDVEIQRGGSTKLTIRDGDIRLNAPINTNGNVLRRGNHHTGHFEGSYNNIGANGAKSNPIYTIGSSYNPSDAALSNMYGIGFSDEGSAPSFFPGSFVGGWGLYVAADGDARVFLDGSSGHGTFIGEVKATKFVDIGNTGFYADLANLSNLHRLALNPPSSGTLPVLQVNQGSGSHQGIAVDINQANAGNAIDVRGSVGSGHFTVSSAYNSNPVVLTTGSHRAPYFYDSDNTSFYGDFAGTSNMQKIHFATPSNTAINVFTGNNSLVVQNTGSSTAGGLVLRASGGAHLLQMYGDGSGYGFLTAAWGSWDLQKVVGGKQYYNNNQNYWVNPVADSKFERVNVNGGITPINDGGGQLKITSASNGTTTINASVNTVVIAPLSTRTATGNQYYGGIAWGGLYNYQGGNTYDNGAQVWIGSKYHDFPGSERSKFVVGIKSGTGLTNSGNDIPVERFSIDYLGSVTATGDYRAPRFYDSNDTAKYMDPASTSQVNAITSTRLDTSTIYTGEVYNSGWFRNSSNSAGLYNSNTGQHFSSSTVNYWDITSSANAQGLRLRTAGHPGTVRGYFYADSGNNVGILDSQGGWKVRVVSGDYVIFDGSSARAKLFYDLDNTNFYVDPANISKINELSAKGHAVNYATSEDWVVAGQQNQAGRYGGDFGVNGDGNSVSWDEAPNIGNTVNRGKIWKTRNNDASSGADGGWNKDITGLNVNKAYMSVVYVRRASSSTNGSFYHGCRGSSTDTLNLSGSGNSNPYFSSFGIGTLDVNEWYVSVGIIQAANDSNTSNWTQGGLWKLETGARQVGYTTFKMGASGAGVQTHRTYLYYSTDSAAALDWYAPGFYEINGSEPSIEELMGRPKDSVDRLTAADDIRAPIYYDSGDTAYYLDPSSSSIAGSMKLRNGIAFDREGDTGAAGDFSTYHDATNAPGNGYSSNNQRYWHRLISKGGTHVVLNSDGSGSSGENSFDHFTIYQYSHSTNSNRMFYVTNVGNVHAKGNITAYQTSGMSDIRLKKDIKPLKGSLDKVLNMQGVSFKWKKDDKDAIGFIAQDVEKIVPEIVREVDAIESDAGDNIKYKTLDYGNTVALLVEAIKELKTEIDDLKEKLENK